MASECFSWRGVEGVLLPVVQQVGSTCYVEAALQAMSAQYKINHMQQDQEALSKQQVINCRRYDKEKARCSREGVEFDELKQTGTLNLVFRYAREEGVCLARDYPFDLGDRECKPPLGTKRYFVRGELVSVDEKNREHACAMIKKHPIAGAVPIFENFETFSGKGVFCPETSAEPRWLGKHAVVLVGYGADNGIEYYEFKNSWGDDWGDEGYGKIMAELVTRISYPPEVIVIDGGGIGSSSTTGSRKRNGNNPGDDKEKDGYKGNDGQKKTSLMMSQGVSADCKDKKRRGTGRFRSHSLWFENFDIKPAAQVISLLHGDNQSELQPQKKPKLEHMDSVAKEEDVLKTSTNWKDENEDISEVELVLLKKDFCPDGVDEIDVDTWSKYYEEIDKSEGFDIDHFPGGCMMTPIIPLRGFENFPKQHNRLIYKATTAINGFNNKEGTSYKFKKIEKANIQGWDTGINSYITFQAEDDNTQAKDTFQALVWSGHPKAYPEPIMKSCKIKTSQK